MRKEKKLRTYWKIVSKKLNLKADIPYLIKYSDGRVQEVDVRLKDFGSKNGILLVSNSNYDAIKNRSKEIIEMGYSYSCLSSPDEEKIEQVKNEPFENLIKEIKGLLSDWTYSGLDSEKPKWLNNKS